MSAPLDQPIAEFHRIAKRLAKPLGRIGIATLGDLLNHLPVRHEDLRVITPIRDILVGARVVVHGRIVTIANRRSPRRRMALTEALVADDTGSIRCVWFHQPYLAHAFAAGASVAVAGIATGDAYGLHLMSPLIELLRAEGVHTSRIIPVYPLTAGVTQKQIRTLIYAALPHARALPETLPAEVLMREQLLGRGEAIRAVHFPTDDAALAHARERLAFEEAFAYFRAVRATREERVLARAPYVPCDEALTKALVAALPFPLTDGQRRAAWDALCDMSGDRASAGDSSTAFTVHPMHRLVNGDVGSGKTVVAAIVAANAARAGFQAAILAPTEILAVQHARTFHQWLAPFGLRTALWTRTAQQVNGEPATARAIAAGLADGTIGIVIGTHLLATARVRFASLALAIVDEQHRFGVAQRAALRAKRSDELVPHLLSMTATPIPRTLSLTLLGDLDVSVLSERPPGRAPVATTVIGPRDAAALVTAVTDELHAGHQAFVVCPQIDAEEEDEAAAVRVECERVRAWFPNARVGVLHGQLRPAEQRAAMAAFASRALDILVATTIIEVGVDQPNATVMVIADAERFGLAQLHQLRGRVGRGNAPGRCFLLTRSDVPTVRTRLASVARCTDGFALAEMDLEERGPGAAMGTAQSGWPEFRSNPSVSVLHRARAAVANLDTTHDDRSLHVHAAHLE